MDIQVKAALVTGGGSGLGEATARELEALRGKWDRKPHLKVFFFAQSADLNAQKVNAYVTHVQVTDRTGRVLAEYGPQYRIRAAMAGR